MKTSILEWGLLTLVLAGMWSGCPNVETVATPTISPSGGLFPAGSKAVTFGCGTDGAVIYYTIDNSDPTTSDTKVTYANTPFDIIISTTPIVIKAIAMKTDFIDSQIGVARFMQKLETVLVEKGTFSMGLETGGDSDERPVHTVTLTQDFYMGKFEVTQSEWKAVMGSLPSGLLASLYGIGDTNPVYNISWHDSVAFCNRLSIMEGLKPCYTGNDDSIVCDFTKNGYRLPTEAEWEYAARGGKHESLFVYSGSDMVADVAWYFVNSGDKTHPVGSKAKNALGIHDMGGNVYEWCWDWYGVYSGEPQENPWGASGGSYRVRRGGSFYSNGNDCRVANRIGKNPDSSYYGSGLRVVRSSLP